MNGKTSSSVLPAHGDKVPAAQNPRWIDRLEHFTWAWYCFPMATGGIALLISSQPHTFTGLHTIGKIVYIWDLVVFSLVTIAITYRFIRFPGTLKSSLTHPTESLFFATSLLSVASIIACIGRYGIPATGPWLVTTYLVLFWIYFATTFCLGLWQYMNLFTNPRLKIQDMTPAWDLPIFPFMLCGTLAVTGAPSQPEPHAMPMLVAGLTAQGLGFTLSILMFASYMRRMIQYGLPSPASRPGMFISVGPPSFTALALIGLADAYPTTTTTFGPNATTRQVLAILATCTAVFIWSLALWFFAISLLAVLAVAPSLTFHLNCWAFVFPNVGFTLATIAIAAALHSPALAWLASALSLALVATYLVVAALHLRALRRRRILWSGLDEDVHVHETMSKKEPELRDARTELEAQRMLSRREEEEEEHAQ